MTPRRVALGLAAGLVVLSTLAPAAAPLQPLALDRGGTTGLALALRKLGVSARVLWVSAHPDDEDNGLLVRLSRGLGVRTGLFSETRGEGGQNAIGPEFFEALGVLRTAELEAMHRYDGAEQSFGRAYEFGFSFSVEETFAKWGREETLGDVVRILRAFRPDVVITLPPEGTGGGQHHQAVGRLTVEAFRVAADASRFPEQLKQGLRPWQARKLYQGWVGGIEGEAGSVRVPTGVYDPVLGMTWRQLGSRARAVQRCQGTAQLVADPGPAESRLLLLDSEPKVSAPETDILDGVEATLTGIARFAPGAGLDGDLAALQAKAAAARAAFDARNPAAAVPALAEDLTAVRSLLAALDARVGEPAARAEVADRVRDEEADVEMALVRAEGLELDAFADDGLVVPGQEVGVTVSVANGGGRPVDVGSLEVTAPKGWTAARGVADAAEKAEGTRFRVTVAAGAPPTQPYWRKEKDHDRFALLVPADESLPWSPPAVVAQARVRVGGVEATMRAPVAWRYEGPFVGGEKRHELQVVPAVSVRVSPEVSAVPLTSARRPLEVHVFARGLARGSSEATLRVEAPAGWTVVPPSAPVRFAHEGEEAAASFRLVPPAAPEPGAVALTAVAVRDGREYRETVQAVEYDHIDRKQLLRPAETRLLVLDVRTTPRTSVGYVMGSGDAVADAIRQLGVPLTLLTSDDLRFGDLSRFTTIVTGIRAYEMREDLRSSQARLMNWVEAGGHLVVQYNRDAFNRLSPDAPAPPPDTPSPFVPYPALVTSERITDENAPVRALVPDHPLLTSPNRIGASDWEGWVQERGIQFLAARDDRYQDLLAATDPFPGNAGEKRGMLVDAAVGQGTWTYVGLDLFREVPAGVPGGWRLLANLVGRPGTAPPGPRPGRPRLK
jgi:LmbE family N-acetylglucosaminyl deacetylase